MNVFRSRTSRRAWAVGALVLTPLALAGCASEVIGLASGGSLNEAILSAATVDVLVGQKVTILAKPVCVVSTTNPADYTCNGKAAKGEPIVTTVTDGQSGNTNPHMSITVGGTSVYQGEIVPVLNNAMVVTQ